ncbi:MAG: fibronectin type III domain-containing protein [Prevotellaceae bacterium]|jgi:hypothetical protein|nr:fibronectin type III domain-containing protein [Prevotellaceae bacterium]
MKALKFISLLTSIVLLAACHDDRDSKPKNVTILSENVKANDLLELNVEYKFSCQSNTEIASYAWTLEIFTQAGEMVPVSDYVSGQTTFDITMPSIDVIAKRDDYARTQSGMLQARVSLKGSFIDGEAFETSYPIELPYIPKNPILRVKSIVDYRETLESDVVIEFSSFQPVTSYIFKLQMDGTPSIEYYTLPGTQNTYSLTNLWMDLSYTFWVKAVNQYGESEYVELHIGGDPNYYTN